MEREYKLEKLSGELVRMEREYKLEKLSGELVKMERELDKLENPLYCSWERTKSDRSGCVSCKTLIPIDSTRLSFIYNYGRVAGKRHMCLTCGKLALKRAIDILDKKMKEGDKFMGKKEK